VERTVYILNGPNLNLLGQREPETYGRVTLADIEAACRQLAGELGLDVEFRQKNGEGEIVSDIHDAIAAGAAGIIINAGAYTHTSIAIHDALRAFSGRIIEVHLSNTFAREPFRHRSFISPVAEGVIAGLGLQGYLLALRALAARTPEA
jgi:3-dehydroquinate dehydratase-2